MYEAFDFFLDVETWHTQHLNDEERFYRALKKVVENPRFNPDEMARYMRDKLGVDGNDETNTFNSAIHHYTDAAWAIQGYLKV